MKRWTLDLDHESPTDSPRAAEVVKALRDGMLVGVPTETVYGLAADATQPDACARIFSAKRRPRFNPLISHVASFDAATEYGYFNDDALKLAEAFWPGPLTLVLPIKPGSPICDLATAGLDSVALRVPAGLVMRFLSEQIGGPLAAPSANVSGKISATTADDVVADLGDKIAYVVDAGPCPIGIESTIVACLGPPPQILRSGGVSREAIEAVLGRSLQDPEPEAGAAPQAPGMLLSHYAPSASVRLDAADVKPGEALLAFGPKPPRSHDNAVATLNLSPTGDLTEAAKNFFSGLRQLDRTGAHTICVQTVPETGLGEAINDRLRRAAAPRGTAMQRS